MILIEKKKKATVGCEKKTAAPFHSPLEIEEEFRDEEATKGCEKEKNEEKKLCKEKKNKEKEEDPAFSAALRILAAGANSTFMLREKLIRKGFSSEEAEKALEKVAEAGLINDKRLLEGFVFSLAKKKHYGAYRIRMEATRKFGKACVAEYLEDAISELDFVSYAIEYAKKNQKYEKKALFAKLQRQGYGISEIKKALAALENEADDK